MHVPYHNHLSTFNLSPLLSQKHTIIITMATESPTNQKPIDSSLEAEKATFSAPEPEVNLTT
jgi:hypothetical protein